MPQHVLVTGSNGLLGQKLTDLLAGDAELKLVATGKGANRHPLAEGYVYEPLDIMDEDRLRSLVQQYQPSHLVNTAALTHVDKCETERELCWDLNVRAVEIMCRVCKEEGVKLVHLSTDFIFDGSSGPYVEEDAPNPVSYYGESKLEGERIVQASGVAYSIARTMLVFGLVADMSRSNIVLWAKGALEKGETIRVVNDQFRSPTLAEDLADGVARMVRQDVSGVYHISGPEMVSIVEMVRQVAAHYGLAADLIEEIDSASLGQAAKRPPVTGFDISKARRDLGYAPRTIAEGLKVLDAQLRAFVG